MPTAWESMWSAGLKPGELFDASCPAPILVKLCESGELTGHRAFVPGCGRGYAAAQLATVFSSVIGLDVAPTAVAAAKEQLYSYDMTIQERW